MQQEWAPRTPAPKGLPAGIVVLSILVAIGLVVFGLNTTTPTSSQQSQGAAAVTLAGVQLDFFYSPGSPVIFGANQQEACQNCPIIIPAGAQITLGSLFSLAFPANGTVEFWLNATSPVPIEEWSCGYSGARPSDWPAQGCPFTNDYHQGEWIIEGGLVGSWPLIVSVPNPAPSLPAGFIVQVAIYVVVVHGG
jgi:hypothetical protein